MSRPEFFPEELSFLKNFHGDRYSEYRHSVWLLTPFDANVWVFNFESPRQYKVDFRVKLENGSLLTDRKNHALLELFKGWICIQTHRDVTGTSTYTAQTANAAIRRVLTLIDYFLINSDYFKLSQYGLSNVTENDIHIILAQLSSSSVVSTSIYQWPTRLKDYLQEELLKADINFLTAVIKQNPFLAENIPDLDDRTLNLTEQDIVYSRALLWSAGLYENYYRKTRILESYRFSPSTKKLSKIIYVDTLKGDTQKPLPFELLLGPIDNYIKEYKSAPIRNDSNDFLNEIEMTIYRKVIRSLGLLVEIEGALPLNALDACNSFNQQNRLMLKPKGRYCTLPQPVVLTALCRAVEFGLSYGSELLESVISIIRAAKLSGKNCSVFVATSDIRPLLHPKIRDMGVQVWNLANHMSFIERNPIHSRYDRPPSSEYFKRLRNNEGLHELLRVFYGAVQLCVGTIMARRQGELKDLIHGNVLDHGKTFLLFYNRKSGFGKLRNKEARPIPPVAVKLIELLENFHKQLIDIGVSTSKVQLFSYPSYQTGKPIKLLSTGYNSSLEIFCDYMETQRNDAGERYYIRQHQLRRFFAMMFFWGNSFGGMNTLRWFLGHTDIEHLYHYITESTPGYVLLSSKAHYGSELLKSSTNDAIQLADVVEKHFKTRNFQILDSTELEEYIEELLTDGRVEIEPIFFEGPNGKTFKIAIKTREKING